MKKIIRISTYNHKKIIKSIRNKNTTTKLNKFYCNNQNRKTSNFLVFCFFLRYFSLIRAPPHPFFEIDFKERSFKNDCI